MNRCLPLLVAAGLTAAAAAQAPATPAPATPPAKDAPKQPERAAPGLAVGDAAPGDATLLDAEGKPVMLKNLWKTGPVVITFYRGGWCPFCTRALSAWHDKMPELKAAGATFVAITPETPAEAAKTREKTKLDAAVLVDARGEAGKGFKVHFELDDDTKTKYESYGIDLAKRNQSQKWELDAPATFVIDTKGIVRYVFADWDYKKRADPDAVIQAVKALPKSK